MRGATRVTNVILKSTKHKIYLRLVLKLDELSLKSTLKTKGRKNINVIPHKHKINKSSSGHASHGHVTGSRNIQIVAQDDWYGDDSRIISRDDGVKLEGFKKS